MIEDTNSKEAQLTDIKQVAQLLNKPQVGLFKNRLEVLEEKILGKFKKRIEPAQKFMSYYKCALMEIETKFKVLNEDFSFLYERNPIDSIKTRIKDFDSIHRKLRKLNLPLNIKSIENNIFDIAGIRIICPFIDDIYTLADCLINQDDITLIEKKDYIITPKENGYRSLHLIVEIPIFLQNEKRHVKVEIQLRTISMEFWANLEHRLRYKKDINKKIIDELSKELSECAELCALLDLKMKNLQNRLTSNE
jgi:putative GTP pyrophosphokinase